MASKRAIDSFLSCRRIAVLGVSRDPKDFSRAVFRALLERGYDAVPINPNGSEVEGRPCMRRLSELPGPVEGALLLTPPTATAEAVRDCMAAGVRRVWMHRGAGRGAVSPDAVAFCRERGIEVVDGACPFMFLPETSLFHRIHGFFHRLSGGLSA